MHRVRALLIALLALAATAGIAACGGSGGNDEDPQQVLDQTFDNDQQVKSGSFDVGLTVDVEGGENPGTLEASLGGPFESERGGLPKFDLDAEFKFDGDRRDVDFQGGVTSTGEEAFITYNDTAYAVPARIFDDFEQRYVQTRREADQQAGDGNGNALKALGIDPSDWLTDLSNEGEEEVNGAETIHVQGQADVAKLVDDLSTVARRAGSQQNVDVSQLGALKDIVKTAEFDVYTGVDDKVLRRLDASLVLEPPALLGSAPDTISVELSVGFSDVNEPQTIEAPSEARSLTDLFDELGLDSSQLRALSQGDLPQAGGSPGGPSDDQVQGYLDCLQSAQGTEAVRACGEQYGIGQ